MTDPKKDGQSQIHPLKTFNNVEASTYLKVSGRTLQKYRDAGIIEFSQVGRKIVYTEQQLQAFLHRNTKPVFNAQNLMLK